MKRFLRAKLHNLTVTGKQLHYTGSIQIDPELMQLVGLEAFEVVLVVNITNGSRFETYINPGTPGSREVILQGGGARLGETGDKLIVMAFEWGDRAPKPRVVFLKDDNRA